MNIYISVDMEGLAGTHGWRQEEGEPGRSEIRDCMRRQVAWVIDGIRRSPRNPEVDEIVVADAHGRGDTLPWELTALDPRLKLVSGSPRPCYMMPAFDGSASVVMFVGYHAGVGTPRASMDHTYSGSAFHGVWLDGAPANEALLNAAYAGAFGVPVGLVTGDEALRDELAAMPALADAEFVVTKRAVGRFAALHRSVDAVRTDTEAAVVRALARVGSGSPAPVRALAPATLEVELMTTAQADVVALMPCAERLGGRRIRMVHESWPVLFDALMAVVYLAGAAR